MLPLPLMLQVPDANAYSPGTATWRWLELVKPFLYCSDSLLIATSPFISIVMFLQREYHIKGSKTCAILARLFLFWSQTQCLKSKKKNIKVYLRALEIPDRFRLSLLFRKWLALIERTNKKNISSYSVFGRGSVSTYVLRNISKSWRNNIQNHIETWIKH